MSFQLSQGTLVQVSPSLVKRRKTHFHNLPCGASIILGNNGYVWISPTVNEDTENTGGFIENHEVRLSMIVYIHWCWAGSFSRSEVLSYLYLPSSFTLFLSLFLRGIQLAKVIVFDQIGRIKALDPCTDLTSRCHLGHIHTDPQMTVEAYPHTAVWVPIGCSQGLWGR